MVRTTVYLPDDLKESLERVARAEHRSVAELIREGARRVVASHDLPRPTIPLFESDDPQLSERVDEYLDGFGS